MKLECERHIEFVVKVQTMRTAQKEYFRTRYPQWLAESKRLEAEVDAMIKKEIEKE